MLPWTNKPVILLRLIPYWKPTHCSLSSSSGVHQHFASSTAEIRDVLLVAYLTKALSQSGIRNLDHSAVPLTEDLVLQVLSKKSLSPSRKLEFFRWCSLRNNYKHTVRAYSCMFRTLCLTETLEDVVSLVSSMKQDGVVVEPEIFQLLLDTVIRFGEFDWAIEILDAMQELEITPSLRMYDSVLVALATKGQLRLALSMFMKRIEVPYFAENDKVSSTITLLPGSVACNTVLSALKKANMMKEFNVIFEKLREHKEFELDVWGYNICIHAFGCWGNLNASLKLFKEMKEKSSDSRTPGPDLCTYNCLIHILCFSGKVKDALIIYEELKHSGYDPDAFTYRILVRWCCRSYKINHALNIFREMQRNGYLANTVMYNSLLNGLFKARKVIDACQLYEKMVWEGVRSSCWTYNILIDGLFRNGRVEAGYTLFCDLKKKGQHVDGITFSIVILQLCKEGLLDEALDLLEEMQDRGFLVDLVTFTSLYIGFHKHGRWDSTDKIMKRIRESNLVAKFLKWRTALEVSMKSHQSRSKDDSAMFPGNGDLTQIVSSMHSPDVENEEAGSAEADIWSPSPYMDSLADQANSSDLSVKLFTVERGLRVHAKSVDYFDSDMFNTFLSIFLSKGKVNLACKLFEIFSGAGVERVSFSYNSIMSAFVKKGYFNKASDVFTEMGENLCPADIATYNLIIQGLGKMGRADLAGSVLDNLLTKGGHLDVIMYNTLIYALGKAGRHDACRKFLEQMKGAGISPDVVTYNTLIEVHSKAGLLKDAYKYLKMMLDAGCLPNHITDTILDYLAKEIEKQRYEKASILRQNNGPAP